MDNWVDPIKDQVAWEFGYINWEGFKEALKRRDETAWAELDIIVSKTARAYGKDVEQEYQGQIEHLEGCLDINGIYY